MPQCTQIIWVNHLEKSRFLSKVQVRCFAFYSQLSDHKRAKKSITITWKADDCSYLFLCHGLKGHWPTKLPHKACSWTGLSPTQVFITGFGSGILAWSIARATALPVIARHLNSPCPRNIFALLQLFKDLAEAAYLCRLAKMTRRSRVKQ